MVHLQRMHQALQVLWMAMATKLHTSPLVILPDKPPTLVQQRGKKKYCHEDKLFKALL
jgi:hypothetical protein